MVGNFWYFLRYKPYEMDSIWNSRRATWFNDCIPIQVSGALNRKLAGSVSVRSRDVPHSTNDLGILIAGK